MLDAAEEVCADIGPKGILSDDVLDLLTKLVDKSLVVLDESEGKTRERMLETIREYAHEKLSDAGESESVRERHLLYFLKFAEQTEPEVRSTDQATLLRALDREYDNLRAAMDWATQRGESEYELRLASALWRYWRVRSYFSEGRRWLEHGLAHSGNVSTTTRIKALIGAGSLANYQADYARGADLLEQALAACRAVGDLRGVAMSLNALAHSQMMTGDTDGAHTSLEESLRIFRELNDTRGIAYALYFIGSLHLSTSELARARPVLGESLMRLREIGDQWWIGNVLIQLGWAINRQGEHAAAKVMLEQVLAIARAFDDKRGTARALLYLGDTAFMTQDYAGSRRCYADALALFKEVGDRWWGTVCIESLATVAAMNAEARRAAQLFGAAERLHVPGILARLRLLDRIRLTPEGSSLGEAMRLTEAGIRTGQRVFVLSYHSSTLKIGETSYVRTATELTKFLAWIEGFLGRSGLVLLHDETLLRLVDGWLADVGPDSFTQVLPVLRRTFSTFPAGERRQIGERVRRFGPSDIPNGRGRGGRGTSAPGDAEDLDAGRAALVLPVLRRILGAEPAPAGPGPGPEGQAR